ncbi:hypothetical protein FLAG1_06046 [Fusarium langsethiae]|uniref:F-box domain-containing protein n=1 Tax=Fusarium langsethiae TaxID=179993 RepID=A0A0M9EW19_FUSLA|nr:hypothetical protein FLAG1_06046 [Fusarium langsethiae]GKU00103.1 unnamed protein product [Fusarium langsethiae]GKU18499.1 unnamed protein product [Fusarium langsethiae]
MQLSSTAHVHTLGDLWLTLKRRIENVLQLEERRAPYITPLIPAIPEDPPKSRPVTGPVELGLSRYFVDPKRVLGAVDDDDWEEFVHGPPLTDRWWNSDPEYIPDLTRSLLSNLDEYEIRPNPLPSLKDHLEALPQEIKDHILQFLLYDDFPLECTYLLDQSYWYTLFLQIPFLWDLDLAMVHTKLFGNSSDGQKVAKQYDWEKLTRQVLTPIDVVDPDVMPPLPSSYARVGLVVPQGLQNRRRIWQIVEEMEVNDVRMEDRRRKGR